MKQDIALTVDAVILYTEKNAPPKVLLIKRKNEPYKGKWALPGGFVELDETLKEACLRELKEETGLQLIQLESVGVYDALHRDPRGRTISVAYTQQLQEYKKVKANDDAIRAAWVSIDKCEALAFDHTIILNDAIKVLKIKE